MDLKETNTTKAKFTLPQINIHKFAHRCTKNLQTEGMYTKTEKNPFGLLIDQKTGKCPFYFHLCPTYPSLLIHPVGLCKPTPYGWPTVY